MNITRIKLAAVAGYASEDTGDIINFRHPSVIVQVNNSTDIIFPFTSEKAFAIMDTKTERPDPKFYYVDNIWANTAIRTGTELREAEDYYISKGNYKLAEKLHIGMRVYHHIEDHHSYLEEVSPILKDNAKIKVVKMEYYSKCAVSEEKQAEVDKNKAFFTKALKMIETSMILNKSKHFESSTEPIEYPFELKPEPFSLSDRVDIAYEVNDKRRDIEKTERISKIEYVENLRHMKCFTPVEKYKLLAIELDLKIKAVEHKIEQSEYKYAKVEVSKKQAVFEGNVEKYKELKEELVSIGKSYNAKQIERQELKEDLTKLSEKIDKLEDIEKDKDNIESDNESAERSEK